MEWRSLLVEKSILAVNLLILTFVIVISILHQLLKRKNDKLAKRKHELDMELERIEQVYHFRMRMMYVFGANWSIDNVADFMPSYEAMVKSDKPLVASEWVNVDKLVNLN